MFNVYQIWDPLKVCIVGRSYSPEFFSWIENPRARTAMEKVAQESEEDFQLIIKKLESFGVEVLRPNLPEYVSYSGKWGPNLLECADNNNTYYSVPPMLPRDHLGMIGTTFYESKSFDISIFYRNVKDPLWPECNSFDEFQSLPNYIQQECYDVHGLRRWLGHHNSYDEIFDLIRKQGNTIRSHVRDDLELCNTAQLRLLGQDLIAGTWNPSRHPAWGDFSKQQQQEFLDNEFPDTRNHIFDTQGHADSSFCPVMPGVILTVDDFNFGSTFRDWDILHIPNSHLIDLDCDDDFPKISHKWRIPGFDQDDEVVDIIERKLAHWVGDSSETVFDIGVLHIDEKNILTFGNHEPTLNYLEKHGMTVHQIPFRHRWFWDGGIHCVTCDIHREGYKKKIL